MGATNEELFASFQAQFPRRVHRRTARTPFAGSPGHHYFVPRRLSSAVLAQTTLRSRHAEVSMVGINGHTHVVSIGNPGVATAMLIVPARSSDITSFEWIAHTHPLEQENEYQGVARGPTPADFTALNEVASRFGNASSVVIVCRGGRVVDEVEFHAEPQVRTRPGRIWTPGP
jgi:hypothetical protein